MTRSRLPLLAALAALAMLVGCGDDDGDTATETETATETATAPVSEEDFSRELEQIDQQVSDALGTVFTALEALPENVRVPEQARNAAEEAANVERGAADRLAELDPPEDARAAVEGLEREARAQADAIEDAAQQEDVRVGELADALEQGNPERYLTELEELGYLPRNDADEGNGGQAGEDQ